MKQTKWQRLATIGLCSSLVINAFSGVTAVAETITIESSPTVASSAKEATSASSATPESTESSQETTETSREEVTQETEKQAEVAAEKKEAPPVKAEQEKAEAAEENQSNSVPLPVNGLRSIVGNTDNYSLIYDELANFLNRPRVNSDEVALSVPELNLGFNVEETNGTPVNAKDFNLSASINFLQSIPPNSSNAVTIDRENVLATKESNSLNFKLPSKTIVTYSDPYVNHSFNFYYLDKMNLTVPKYVNSVDVSGGINQLLSRTGSAHVLQLINPSETSIAQITMTKINDLTFSLSTNPGMLTHFYENAQTVQTVGTLPYLLMIGYSRPNLISLTASVAFPKTSPKIIVDLKKVTENFVDATGAKITPPTGFTQGQQTSITSNDFTYTSAKALPDTYKASNGKTYKFKGWYKGKTKPNTLTTTKAPSYAVTYDDNDDLNVVYEEIEAFDFPALTYQFGFVDESGKRVDASTIKLTYDNWHGEGLATNSADSNKPDYWKTVSLEKGQVAPTKNNLKEIAYPAQSLEILSDRSTQHSAANLTFTLPNYYEKISVYNKSGTFDIAYPFPNIQGNNYSEPIVEGENKLLSRNFELKNNGRQSFIFNRTITAAPIDIQVPSYLRKVVHNPNLGAGVVTYLTIDKPVYYYLTNRKVTENFVDTNGTKIAPPTGFTQGKQTVINSDPYTFKQSGTLPDTYQADGKTYKFKGWYKGKVIPNTLTTTKAPSYAVTYDGNDDLNVVYEEATEFPEETYQFGFVNEAGQLVNPDDINLTYDYKSIVYRGTGAAGSTVSFGTIANNQSGVKVGNLRQVTLPAKNIAQPTVVGWNGEAFANFSIKLPKYYKSLNLYDKTGKIDPKYPLPVKTTVSSVSNDTVQPEANVIAELTLTQRADGSFTPREIYSGIDSSVRYPPFLRRTVSYSSSGSITALYQTISGPVYYHLTNRKVTENFVNTSGAKITPPAGFTQGNQIPMTSNTFKYTSAKALPASYSAGGKTYVFQGWYKGKTKPNTLTTSTTPAYNTTFDDNDDMTAVYKEASISANLTMRGAVDVIDNGAAMEYWEVLLKNTGEAPLTSVKIKPTTDWAAGMSTPTELFILGTGQNTKVRPITKEQWEAGFEIPLDSSLPVGGQLTINLLGTKVTGQPNQVLKVAVEVTGDFNKLTASDTVRIKDLDQETKEPTGEGFISVPTFNFGQVGVAGSTQQHSLKKAADYYGNGTRNPYLRIKKTQPNWSLTAQLSQPKSATDSLPTATRLLLGAAPVSSFSNYNQPTELKNAVGTTSAISLNANNTATRIIANQQFTGSNIYQLDFTFNNVKLEVPANQGVKGQQYQAAITWNLVTGP
ncbi:WxL domain-containing protein [Enterococcus faecalis]|uniref:WxL domain-containing protein n=6 Tax=Enterococcus faecalis TaxID=1351 RepID=UPI000B72CFAF|nr:WxL domain-containing protein [Enterococcus faecalis]MDK7971349.1 WxL domain-containing protein [Enterococcus faecalis]MDK8158360.1 WxL domain-containing protein [Enterococcus faecalis]MDK8200782.1 WxL domain-containing protein [Enterococcus faecalis]NSQ88060.1 WxL domain-containing protein [Enterococcus faecalis]NSS36274.1 WxL domain-containing protein [Enterococcus faecalis]